MTMYSSEDAPSIPDIGAIDPVSGYNVKMRAVDQGYPLWWRAQPEAFASFLAVRKQQGYIVDDGITAFETANPSLVQYYSHAN